jgi:hypothetical protein
LGEQFLEKLSSLLASAIVLSLKMVFGLSLSENCISVKKQYE